MAKIIDTTLTCSFCRCKFKIGSEDIKVVEEEVFKRHYTTFKRIYCPLCGELVAETMSKLYKKNTSESLL